MKDYVAQTKKNYQSYIKNFQNSPNFNEIKFDIKISWINIQNRFFIQTIIHWMQIKISF